MYTTYTSTRASLAHGGAVQGDTYVAGGSAAISAILSSPTTFLKGLTKYGSLAKQRSSSSPRQINFTNDQAADDARATADAQEGGSGDAADLQANTASDLLDNEEAIADSFLDGTFYDLDDEGVSAVTSSLGDAISGLSGEVTEFGAELAAGSSSTAVEAATTGFGDLAGTLAEAAVGVGETLAETIPDVLVAATTSVAASLLGPEAVVSAVPAGIVAVYFGVAGAAAGIAALVAEIEGNNASDAAQKILGIFFQPGQYDGSGYNLGALFQGEKNTDVDNGTAGTAGGSGAAGAALGGGFYTAAFGFAGTTVARPAVSLQNTIVAGNTATGRKYTFDYYANSPGSRFGDITITNNAGYAQAPDYPVVTGVASPDAADADLASATAASITSAGGNVVGVAGSLVKLPSDQAGTAASPFDPGLTPVQFDEINSSVVLAEVGNASTIGHGTLNDRALSQSDTDQLGDQRLTVTGNIFAGGSITIDAGAVEYNGSPLFTLGGDQEVLSTTTQQTVLGFATVLATSPLAADAALPVTYAVTDVSNAGLFAVAPAIGGNGTLTYTLAPGAVGVAVLTVTASQGSATSQPQTFAIEADSGTTIEVTSDQPAGTVPAGASVNYYLTSFLPAAGTSLAAGGTVPLAITLPAGFTLTGEAGDGWTVGPQTAGSNDVTATFTATGTISAGYALPQLVLTGTFAAATYAPVLTASTHFTVPDLLNTDSNLVFTNGDYTNFVVGNAGTFRLTPNESATLSESATDVLPAGLSFDPATKEFTGTPAVGSGGTYTLHVTATGLVGQDYTQAFTITVVEPLSVVTTGSLAFTAGTFGSYSVTGYSFPSPITSALLSLAGPLPAGLTITSVTVGDHTTVTLSGTPAAGTGGTYTLQQTLPTTVLTPIGPSLSRIDVVGVTSNVNLVVAAIVPTLTGLSQPSAVYGSSAVTLTLAGTGFTSAAVVTFNGQALATTFVNATTLSAVVPAASLLAAGTDPVAVTTAAGTSAALTFTVTKATPIVTVAISSGTAPTPKAAVAGVGGAAVTDGTVTYAYFDANGNPLSAAPTAAGTYAVAATFGGDANYLPATSARVAYSITAAATLADVTAKVSVARGGLVYNARTKTYTQTLTITNTSAAALTGPLSLLLTGLSSTATLANATGSTTVAHGSTPAATPYLTLSAGSLAAGGSVTVTLQFTTTTAPTYGLQLLAGAGVL